MKNKVFVGILLLLALLPACLPAQNITGIWKGELYIDSTKQYIPYEISISEDKGKLSGFSHISFEMDGKEQMGVMKLKVKQNGDEVIIEDDEFIANTFSKSPPKAIKKRMELLYSTHDSVMVIKGDWSTNRTKRFLSATGKVEMHKKIDFKATALYKKLDELKLSDQLVFKEPEPVAPKEEIKPAPVEPEPELIEIAKLPETAVEKASAQPVAMQSIAIKTTKKANLPAVLKPFIPEKPKETEVAVVEKKPVPVAKPAPPPPAPSKPVAVVKPAPKPAPPVAVAKPVVAEQPKAVPQSVVKPVTTLVPASIAKQAATDVSDRKTNTIQSVYYHSDSLTITLYDNGDIDGDTVSVLMNGKVIIAKQRLTTTYNSKSIYIDKDTPDSLMIVMYAENLGAIPPNTGLLVVHDGESVYEVRFSADLTTNAAIIFRRRKE